MCGGEGAGIGPILNFKILRFIGSESDTIFAVNLEFEIKQESVFLTHTHIYGKCWFTPNIHNVR